MQEVSWRQLRRELEAVTWRDWALAIAVFGVLGGVVTLGIFLGGVAGLVLRVLPLAAAIFFRASTRWRR